MEATRQSLRPRTTTTGGAEDPLPHPITECSICVIPCVCMCLWVCVCVCARARVCVICSISEGRGRLKSWTLCNGLSEGVMGQGLAAPALYFRGHVVFIALDALGSGKVG